MKFFVWSLFSLAGFAAWAQPASIPASARQLAEWQTGNANARMLFEAFVLASYKSLLAEKVICFPGGRTDIANDSAVLEAARMGVEEGLFDYDTPAKDALTDALAFWYPCLARR